MYMINCVINQLNGTPFVICCITLVSNLKFVVVDDVVVQWKDIELNDTQ